MPRLLLSLTLLACAALPVRAQIAFPEPIVSEDPVGDLAGGDFDGDGDRDLVSVGSGTSTLATLWINDGQGVLSKGPAASCLPSPRRAWMADLDLDGALDVVVISGDASLGGVSACLGDGAGGFAFTTTRGVHGAPRDGAVADVDADGFPDVATCNVNTADTALLLGTGTGGFGPPLYQVAGTSPVGLALPDLDGDGDPDLLVANNLGADLRLRLNSGRGAFGASTIIPLGGNPTALRTARLDGDTLPDALAPCADGTLRILRADGAGGLLAPQLVPILTEPQSLETADLDLDGDEDVVITHGVDSPDGLSVLLGDGTGSLAVHSLVPSNLATALDLGDLDGDFLPDAAAGRGNTAFTLYRGDGLGALLSATPMAVGPGAVSVALADLDGDGDKDVVVANAQDGTATWLPGGVGTSFGAPSVLPSSTGHISGDVAAADVTGDGLRDILTANADKANVSLLVGDGAGGFAAPVTFACGLDPRVIVTAALDGNGVADVVSCNANSGSVSVLLGGGGTLQPAASFTAGSHPTAMAAGHFDANGTVDVITANEFGGDFSLLRGDGAGGLLAKLSMPGDGVLVKALALADLDGDGDDDLLSVYGSSLVARRSDGATGFSSMTTVAIQGNPVDVLAADFDVDGALDVAVAHASSPFSTNGRVSVVRGLGDGTFAPPKGFMFRRSSDAIAAADLDDDGYPDLVATSASFGDAVVLRNLAGGPEAWFPLDHALAGDFAPKLAGAGTLLAGSPGALTWFDAPPLAPGALFFAPTSAPVAFKGGTLVPVPPAVTMLVVLPADGRLQLAWPSFPPLSAGSTFFFQGAAMDAGAPAGVDLSDALEAVVP